PHRQRAWQARYSAMIRLKILVVDDDPEVRKVIRYGFSDEYEVFEAADGRAGVEILKEQGPALIFLDMELPDVNGIQVLASMLEVDSKCIVVMLTGNEDMSVVRRALEMGAVQYVTKPFDLDYLQGMVRDKLGRGEDKSGRPWRLGN
ncbi:MAG: response regulator, partial [candidate division NC10 bacterium]